MTFTPANLCRIPDDFYFAIREVKKFPLILVKNDGTIIYATNRGEKDTLVESCNFETDILMLAWPGQYSTSIFRVTSEDIVKWYNYKLDAEKWKGR